MELPNFKPCVVIPEYNHGSTLESVLDSLISSLPVFLVDDGSDAATKDAIRTVLAKFPQVSLVVREKNGGKGAAVADGIKAAFKAGFSHALQIDADGQHDTERVPFFLEQAKAAPEKCICGFPQFDESVPASRAKGRNISNGWAHFLTRSPVLKDVLCGFRVYPLEPVYKIITKKHLDMRMGFDPEILIRLFWAGVDFEFYPVKVQYPADGVSHFHLFRDNVRISWMFARLCCQMPFYLFNRRKHG
jgi:glycosyltransferase involved in cell wall biosynthesis